jgi:hypothetical protein
MGIDLQFPAFSHGQLYVALSQVTDVCNLTVLLPESQSTTTNIVYPEVLEDLEERFNRQLYLLPIGHILDRYNCRVVGLALYSNYRFKHY